MFPKHWRTVLLLFCHSQSTYLSEDKYIMTIKITISVCNVRNLKINDENVFFLKYVAIIPQFPRRVLKLTIYKTILCLNITVGYLRDLDNATVTAPRLPWFYRDAEYIPRRDSTAHASIDGPIRTMRIRELCVCDYLLFLRVVMSGNCGKGESDM